MVVGISLSSKPLRLRIFNIMGDTVVVEQSPESMQSPYTNTESENGKSPFACNVCNRSYRRVDHLARHYRSRKCERTTPEYHTDHRNRHARKALRLQYMRQGILEDVKISLYLQSGGLVLTFFRDLLKRHSIGHNDRKDPRRYQTSAPQLARVAQACTACASSKLKCGNQKPCQRCRQRGIACTFAPQNVKPKRGLQKGSTPKSEY